MRVGFIGIGVMGRSMALNLLKAGHELSIYARYPEKAGVQEVLAAGAHLAPSPRAIAIASELVITMVPSSAEVEEVVAGPGGLLDGARQGLVIADMSTIAPATSRKMAQLAASKGVAFLDAPVSGGSNGAQQGTLTIMVGGDPTVFEQIKPVFAAMGKKENIFYIGASGSGAVVKLVNNLLVGIIQTANVEALTMGVKEGLDVETILKIVSVSSGANFQLLSWMPKAGLKGNFEPGFMTDLLYKDLGLALDVASSNRQPAPMTALARQLFEFSRANGYGQEDSTALLKVEEQLSGVEIRLAEQE